MARISVSAKPDPPNRPTKTKYKRRIGVRRKLSEFNRFMRAELRRLKEAKPDITHRERFKAAAESWSKSKPKAST